MTPQKAIIFDASTIITFAMNGMFDQLRILKEAFDGMFLITKEVHSEIIDNPIQRKRFELEALRIKQLVDIKVLEMPSALGIKDYEITQKTNELMNIGNNLFKDGGKTVKIISVGETSCLALSSILTKKGIKNALAIDERTMRMLIEKPENLNELLQRKMHFKVKLTQKNFKPFQGFKVIRSTELAYILHKKGLTKIRDPRMLDALLWAMKFKGCAISDDEIREINRMK